jgi:hypothetical protein
MSFRDEILKCQAFQDYIGILVETDSELFSK